MSESQIQAHSLGRIVPRCFVCGEECDDGVPVVAPIYPHAVFLDKIYTEQITSRHEHCALPLTARDMTPEEIAEGKESVRRWLAEVER